jgi:hypothetical protein
MARHASNRFQGSCSNLRLTRALRYDRFLVDSASGIFTGPFLIICEGTSDARFLCVLLHENQIGGFQVAYPTKATSGGDGVSAIPEYLRAVSAGSSTKNLRGLMVIVDNDAAPHKSFRFVQDALRTSGFAVPKHRGAIQPGSIGTMILTVPSAQRHGTLETLLLDAVMDSAPELKRCIDRFASCTGRVKSWTKNKQAKMRLQSLIAAHCKDDPCTSLAWVWNKAGNPIPKRSGRFQYIVDALVSFAGSV